MVITMIHDLGTTARLYRTMLLIRRVEEHICKVYDTDVIKSPVHLSIGQESIAAGVCAALKPEDILFHTYRSHATYIAKGGNLKKMMAELYGKSTGCSGGKAGSMHLGDIENGVMGASAIVASTIPVACGYALAEKMKKSDKMVICFFGDGATEEGCFYESINFAALKKLPILFVCENNNLAIHSSINNRRAGSIQKLVESIGIGYRNVRDGDVFKIKETTQMSLKNIWCGDGPQFIELSTYRWMEHVGVKDDHNEIYRNEHEYARWKNDDQIFRLEKILEAEDSSHMLKTMGILKNPASIVNIINEEVETTLQEAIEFAQQSQFPESSTLLMGVYA